MAHKKPERTPRLSFVRAGALIVNLDHVAAVSFPLVVGAPLTLTLTSGTQMQLSGPEADAFLEALGVHCGDVTPPKQFGST